MLIKSKEVSLMNSTILQRYRGIKINNKATMK
ncbi:hypothetical protein Cp4447_01781 [Clostridium perfringens]|uniref:Uncharacterized protein n=1 Tax=Clostridium perfringens TaxID=1502 RepID=A0A2X2WQ06_CLOPF|nr:hypothetical protein [Clostridium perfringens]MDH5060127.1 hypothetical protein [Clostridium perfringens NCTC 8239]MDG6880087.1 hypothetical protein [Clostridium perfringens]MDG6883293.1 hypothetical protein [Clostridium perfringens]MDG6885722.1 hypothetical protein [Clostridium perfringens]